MLVLWSLPLPKDVTSASESYSGLRMDEMLVPTWTDLPKDEMSAQALRDCVSLSCWDSKTDEMLDLTSQDLPWSGFWFGLR